MDDCFLRLNTNFLNRELLKCNGHAYKHYLNITDLYEYINISLSLQCFSDQIEIIDFSCNRGG